MTHSLVIEYDSYCQPTLFSFKQYLDSPYAKPNKWGIAELKRNIKQKSRKHCSREAELNKGYSVYTCRTRLY